MLEPERRLSGSQHSPKTDELEKLLLLQREILADMAKGHDTQTVLDKLCQLIESMVPEAVCSIMLLDPQRHYLNVHAAPSIPDDAKQQLSGLEPGKGAGSCGNAVFRGEPMYVCDTLTDERWADIRTIAKDFGIGACWSIPIHSDNQQILGSFAISSFLKREPTIFHHRLLETASHIAGIALDKEEREQALKQSQQRLEHITDAIPGAVYRYAMTPETGEQRFLFVSKGFEDLARMSREQVIDDIDTLWSRVHPDDVQPLWHSVLESGRTAEPWQKDFRLTFPNGDTRWIRGRSTLETHQQGSKEYIWNGLFLDVTEEKTNALRLQQAAIAFDTTTEGIVITNQQSEIQDVNKAFCDITGYSREEALNQKISMLRSGRHGEDFYQSMWSSIDASGQWQGEIWNRRKNGEVYPQWLSVSAAKNESDEIQYYVGVFADISQIKESEHRLFELAHHDALTGLPNRLLFNARLQHALLQRQKESDQGIALLFLDLDRFKNINDSLGHAMGDVLLQEVAMRIRDSLRESDTVARLGGDEFIVMLENIQHTSDISEIARNLLHQLEQPFHLNERPYYISASIGISLYPRDARAPDALLKYADIAMYRAKASGRNGFAYYTPDLGDEVEERLSLESDLRMALARNEMTVHFQPQVKASTGRIVGAEGLVRWNHPERGLLLPNQFIPLCEDIGLIGELGAWVLERSCTDAMQWLQCQDNDCPQLSVNLSGRQIHSSGFLHTLDQILAKTGFPAHKLELEIIETFVMERPESNIPMLEGIRARGVRLAIDDFGTGYSSLSYLKKLPIDRLKIDKSLVQDIETDPNDAAITRAIIALGHNLQLDIVAEGVESEAQRDFLIAEDCDVLQGYLYDKALPQHQFIQQLQRH